MARTWSAFVRFGRSTTVEERGFAILGVVYLAGFVLCDLVDRVLFTFFALAVGLSGFWLS